MRRLSQLLIVGISIQLMNTPVTANETLVFISEFAAGDEGGINVFRLDHESKKLELSVRSSDVEHPFYLALSPTKDVLYSIHGKTIGGKETEQIASFEINDHELRLLNRQSTRGTASCYLDVDRTGQTVLVANYLTGSVASLSTQEDGSLDESVTLVQHRGSSINKQRQEGPHAHCFVISPDNRFAFAADLGLDKILAYHLDADSSQLTPTKQPFVRTIAGAGPRHLTFHPNGKHVYVINEIANSITRFDYDQDQGFLIEQETISTLPAEFEQTSHTADIKITPNGRFLFGTNRGHDSIASYQIGEDGKLTLLQIQSSRGKGPQNLAISPDGQVLLCANMPGNNVVVFFIDQNTGSLKPTDQELKLTSPSCIVIR